jgi:hypothetical protein
VNGRINHEENMEEQKQLMWAEEVVTNGEDITKA